MGTFYVVVAILCVVLFARALIRWVGLADRLQFAKQMKMQREVAKCRATIRGEKWIMIGSSVILIYVLCKLFGQ